MNITITTISKSEYFRSLFQYINLFTEQINILFQPTQVFIQSMDSAKVSIFELAIPSTWFDSYVFSGEDTIILGLNSSILFKILSARERDQTTNIAYSTEDEDKLFINYTNGYSTNRLSSRVFIAFYEFCEYSESIKDVRRYNGFAVF